MGLQPLSNSYIFQYHSKSNLSLLDTPILFRASQHFFLMFALLVTFDFCVTNEEKCNKSTTSAVLVCAFLKTLEYFLYSVKNISVFSFC